MNDSAVPDHRGGSLPSRLRWPARRWPAARVLHVWRFTPQWLLATADAGAQCLSAGELERLARMTQPARRAHFTAVRIAVRCALASYLDADPAALQFTRGPHGKPELSHRRDLQFSISHAAGGLLLAVASDSHVGIDLESIRARPRDDLARRLLGPAALARYAGLLPGVRDAAFAWAWTEREAFVKALGLGIGDGWTLVQALFAPLELAEMAGMAEEAADRVHWRSVGGWTLHYLTDWPGFAAVACTGHRADRIERLDPPAHETEGRQRPVLASTPRRT